MASITCGNCKQTHDSVDAVKLCYLGKFADEGVKLPPREYVEKHESAVKAAWRTAPQTPIGVYNVGGVLYMVKPSRSSDRTLAHKLQMVGGKPELTYLGLANRFVPENTPPVTREEAAAWGHTHGYCMMCGRLLTNPESVEAGIGPICAGKAGW